MATQEEKQPHQPHPTIVQKATKLASNSEKIKFTNFKNKTKLASDYFVVRKINAIWWLEVTADTKHEGATFSSAFSSPNLQIIIKVDDQELISSGMLSATVDVSETSFKPFKTFFANYEQEISYNRFVIDSASEDNRKTKSKRDAFSHGPWNRKESLEFDCSIMFHFRGDYGQHRVVQNLLKSKKVSNTEVMKSLFEDDEFTDFVFNVRDKQFKVHKCLLSAASSVFKTMFKCGLDESKYNTAFIDCRPAIFQVFLKFIYTGEWSAEEMPTLCFDLYELAHRYEIKSLTKICLVFVLMKKIDAETVMNLYRFAKTYDIKELIDSTWKFIKVEMLDITEQCDPKPLSQIESMLQDKRRYDLLKRRFISQMDAEPSKKRIQGFLGFEKN